MIGDALSPRTIHPLYTGIGFVPERDGLQFNEASVGETTQKLGTKARGAG